MSDLEKYQDQVLEQRPPGFETLPESGGESPFSIITGILRRWYIVLLVFVAMCAIGIPAIWFSIEPLYNVTGAIRVAPILSNILTGQADGGEISNYQSFMNTQAEIMTSRQVVQRVADNLVDRNLAFFDDRAIDLVARLKHALKNTRAKPEPADVLKGAVSSGIIAAEPRQRTELLEIAMKSTNSKEAVQIVNAFIRAYMAVEVSAAAQGQGQKLSVLENERRVLAEKLQNQREAIRQLAQEYGTTTLGGRQDMMLQRVTTLLATLTELEARRINLEAQVQLLERTNQPSVAPGEVLQMRTEHINSDPKVQELTRSIVQLEQELIVARQTFAPANPALKQKQELLDAFYSSLEQKRQEIAGTFDEAVSEEIEKAGKERLSNVRSELDQTKEYEKRLRDVLAKEDAQTIELGRKQLQIQDLQYQLDLDKEMYDTVRRRIRELEMERKRPARISVAFNAEVSHVRDKRVKYSAALVFGALACGMMLAFLKDRADQSLRTPDDVVKRIGIRIIGTTTSPQAVKRRLLLKQVIEDYQTIRANLGLLSSDGMPKKLVVTSPAMQEGKTTFAVNLSTSLARAGKKVLLIDGDLRKPEISSLLGLPKGLRGLQDVLFGREFNQAVYAMPSSGLDVLAADFRNQADAYELLASPLTAQNINMASEAYDHVIIDTPPVLAFPDTLVWAKMADAVILVSFAGQTTAPDLREAKEKLAQLNVKVLGTVLSNVRAGGSYYRYGYNYYAHGAPSRKKTGRNRPNLLLPPNWNPGENAQSAGS
ncbi:MAG: polysaccharide biosynthesis tyrosine autokinase [Planctomycetota bacterium]|jgi:capsular exopolysaccharide synthesis family protein